MISCRLGVALTVTPRCSSRGRLVRSDARSERWKRALQSGDVESRRSGHRSFTIQFFCEPGKSFQVLSSFSLFTLLRSRQLGIFFFEAGSCAEFVQPQKSNPEYVRFAPYRGNLRGRRFRSESDFLNVVRADIRRGGRKRHETAARSGASRVLVAGAFRLCQLPAWRLSWTSPARRQRWDEPTSPRRIHSRCGVDLDAKPPRLRARGQALPRPAGLAWQPANPSSRSIPGRTHRRTGSRGTSPC